jgi:hypothetical protein
MNPNGYKERVPHQLINTFMLRCSYCDRLGAEKLEMWMGRPMDESTTRTNYICGICLGRFILNWMRDKPHITKEHIKNGTAYKVSSGKGLAS